MTLFSLLVADKIKSTLPEACLDHVLPAEGITQLECDAFASTVDVYVANHTIEGRTRFARSDFCNRTGNPLEQANKVVNTNQTVTCEKGTIGISAPVTGPQEPKGVRAGNLSQPVSKNGLCFTYHSPGHKQVNCPMLRTNDNRSGDARVTARNFACAMQTAPIQVR